LLGKSEDEYNRDETKMRHEPHDSTCSGNNTMDYQPNNIEAS